MGAFQSALSRFEKLDRKLPKSPKQEPAVAQNISNDRSGRSVRLADTEEVKLAGLRWVAVWNGRDVSAKNKLWAVGYIVREIMPSFDEKGRAR